MLTFRGYSVTKQFFYPGVSYDRNFIVWRQFAAIIAVHAIVAECNFGRSMCGSAAVTDGVDVLGRSFADRLVVARASLPLRVRANGDTGAVFQTIENTHDA